MQAGLRGHCGCSPATLLPRVRCCAMRLCVSLQQDDNADISPAIVCSIIDFDDSSLNKSHSLLVMRLESMCICMMRCRMLAVAILRHNRSAQAAMRTPFSSSLTAAHWPAAASAAGQAAPHLAAACRGLGSAAAHRGLSPKGLSSPLWQPWGSSCHFPLQPQHVRRWRGIAAMAKGGKQQKKKQDDSEPLIRPKRVSSHLEDPLHQRASASAFTRLA